MPGRAGTSPPPESAAAPRHLPNMDKRSLFIGLGVLFAGVLLGVLMVIGFRSIAERNAGDVAEHSEQVAPQQRRDAARPSATVQIGAADPQPAPAVPELMTLNSLFRGVAARVTPTVVFIEVESAADARSREFEETHPFLQPRRLRRSAGSGVIISAQGHVVTNAHVIAGANRIRVLLNDKREFDAEIIGTDQTTDLAVIRLLDADRLPVATLGNSDELEVGEWVLAVGNPFRLTSTVTAGIVSALGRQVDIIDDSFRIEDFIQTDAAINPGNSGGALVNLHAEVIGIATAIATESGSYEGYGFAVPTKLMTRVAQDLIEFGDVQRGYLGVEIRAVNAEDARRHGLEHIRGVVIEQVAETGAAAEAGLRPGDILLAVDGHDIDATNHFQSAIALRRPGDDVRLAVWRRGSLREVDARLIGRDDDAFRTWVAQSGVRPTPPRERQAPPEGQRDERLFEPHAWGVGFRDLTPDDQQRFGVESGAYVVYVRPGGAAAADGLPPQTVVVEVEGEPVRSAAQAQSLLEQIGRQQASALLRVARPDGLTAFYDVEAPSAAAR
jgi:serine protease Do